MQNGKSIINLPLLLGIALSIAVHGALLYSKGIYTPPAPKLESGRTVVQLTLMPSIASQPALEPADPEPHEPPPEKIPEPVETIPEPIPVPAPVQERLRTPPEQQPVEKKSETTPPNPQTSSSTEQIASLIEDKGVQTQAKATQGIRPVYPRRAQKRGITGTVVLSIQVLTNGKAGTVKIVKSSGNKQLDSAAVQAAKNADYTPAEKFGRTVESELIQPITFELTQ